MNIYNAIMKAADHIERNPGEFNFRTVQLPRGPGCGTPGCAIGWIAVFYGYSGVHGTFGPFTREVLGLTLTNGNVSEDGQFYDRMRALAGSHEWKLDVTVCAATLRKYADKYHPQKTRKETRQGIPSEVRAIFDRVYTSQDMHA